MSDYFVISCAEKVKHSSSNSTSFIFVPIKWSYLQSDTCLHAGIVSIACLFVFAESLHSLITDTYPMWENTVNPIKPTLSKQNFFPESNENNN